MSNMIEEKRIKQKMFIDMTIEAVKHIQNNPMVKRIDVNNHIKVYSMNKEKTNIRIDLIGIDVLF